MGPEWAAIIRAAAPVGQKLLGISAERLLLAARVARHADKAARKRGVEVRSRSALREYLRGGLALKVLSGSGTEAEQVRAQQQFESLLADGDFDKATQAAILLETVLNAYIDTLDVKKSVKLQMQGLLASNAEQASQVFAAVDGVLVTGDLDDVFPATLRDLADKCRESWPSFGRVVRDLRTALDRRELLVNWSESPPDWMSAAPGSLHYVLGELIACYGERAAGARYMERGLQSGTPPRNYWLVRAAMMTLSGEELVDSLRQSGGHPLAEALVHDATGDKERALQVLDDWPTETTSQGSLRANFRSQLLQLLDRSDEAIAASIEGWQTYGSTACAKVASEQLLVRGSPRRSRANVTDIENAQAIAIQARDCVRHWGGPSGELIAVAAKAAQLLGDIESALLLVTHEPAGLARTSEVQDRAVIEVAAHLEAEVGDTSIARELLSKISEPRVVAEVLGLIAIREREREAARAQFRLAIDASETSTDLLRNCSMLAFLGETHERASLINGDSMDVAQELSLVAKAAAGDPTSLDQLRTRARSDPFLSLTYVRVCKGLGKIDRAADQAKYAGETWSDPNFWMIAADGYRELGQTTESIAAAEESLKVSRDSWGRKKQALILLIELQSKNQNWQDACLHSASLVASSPGDESSLWALIECQVQLAELTAAWETYKSVGGAPSPRFEREAIVVVELWSRVSPETFDIEFAERELARWPDSGDLKIAVFQALLRTQRDEPRDERSAAVFRSLIGELESLGRVTGIEVDLDNPLESLAGYLPDPAQGEDLVRQVSEGRIPLGMLTAISGRSFCELAITREPLPLHVGDFSDSADELDLLREVPERICIDTSAAVTLVDLPEDLRDLVLGQFSAVTTSLLQYRDVRAALDSLGSLSTMTLGKTSGSVPTVTSISEAEATDRFDRSERVNAIFESSDRDSKITFETFMQDADDPADFVWLAAADVAATQSLILWCDDAVVRKLVNQNGVRSFSTISLLQWMEEQGKLAPEVREQLLGRLVSKSYVGIPWDDKVMEIAVTLDSSRARGAARVLSLGPPTGSPIGRLSIATRAIANSIQDPLDVEGWTSAAAIWLIRVGGSLEQASVNLVALTRHLLAQDWMSAAVLPFVLDGIRKAMKDQGLERDPFEQAVRLHFAGLVSAAGRSAASDWMLGLTASVATPDRRTVTAVVLEP